jgi:hypothetical protein
MVCRRVAAAWLPTRAGRWRDRRSVAPDFLSGEAAKKIMAHPKGFEPLASAFGGQRSIPLGLRPRCTSSARSYEKSKANQRFSSLSLAIARLTNKYKDIRFKESRVPDL